MSLRRRTLLALLLLVGLAAPGVGAPKGRAVTAKSQLQFGVDMAQRGLWSEALFRFQQAESLGGSPISIYNNMAVAYEALGVFEKAREYYQKALEADASNSALRRNYSRFIEFYQSFQPEGEDEAEEGSPAAPEGSGVDADEGTP